MRFELLAALRNLDARSPEFLRTEALADRDVTMKCLAVKVLATLGDQQAAGALRAAVRVV